MKGQVFAYERAQAVNISSGNFTCGIGGDGGFPHAQGLLIGVAGTLKVTTTGGDTVTMTVPAGLLYLAVLTVFQTGTTATNITALY